jgi:beta-galactosidase/beta-glucuronidase
MKKAITSALFSIAACVCITALAAPNDTKNELKNGVKMANNDDARCKKEVTQYTETLQFVRQSAGEQVSVKVMSSYVPIDQLNQVVSNSGYCAGAQLLRDKKALR